MKRHRRKTLFTILLGVLAASGIFGIWAAGRSRRAELIAAVEKRNAARVLELLQAGTDANTSVPSESCNALQNLMEVLRLRRGDRFDHPVLLTALENRDTATAIALLKAGADPNVRYGGFNTPLFCVAVENADPKATVVKLMVAKGVNINAGDGYGSTALIEAARANRLDITTFLLSRGANPNAIIGHYGPHTALTAAVENGNVPMVQALLQHGADAKITLRPGRTLLQLAKGNKRIIRLLQTAGCKS